MAWIKRNLFFVISVAVGLLLTGYCGYLLYTSLDANAGVSDEYKSTLSNLQGMEQKSPYPSRENIQAAKADQENVRNFLTEFRTKFAPFPVPPVKDDKGFKIYLADSLIHFRAEATNAGVELPPDYGFSFSSLTSRLNYTPGNIAAWMLQLQEMGAILDILYRAKINYLASLCRVPVSLDDAGGTGDCLLQAATVTNQWGVVTPYKITFRGFSTEVAAVMDGFARSSNCFIIKAIDVAPDTSVQPMAVASAPQMIAQPAAPAYAPRPTYSPSPVRGREREGRGEREPPFLRPRMAPVNATPAAPTTVAALFGPPVIFLSENPLLVTLSVDVVKLKASEP